MLRTALYATLAVFALTAAAGAAQAGMLVVHHKVADYAKWRPIFDGDKASQEAAGLTNPHVYQDVASPNTITITFDMADAAKAKAFTSSKELKAAMGKGGVKGKPEIFFLDTAK